MTSATTAADQAGTAPPRLEPDLDQARQFLELLDPDAEAFTFQTFDDSELKRGHLAKVRHGPLDQEARGLAALQSSGAGAFVTINETDGRGRKKENIVRARAVYVDLDGSPLQPVLACALEPHIVVESSPRRWHGYWLVHRLPLDQVEPVQKAIAARFNGDPTVHDLSRVMRMPGFWHQKAEPFLSKITHLVDRLPYPADQILAEFPPPEPENKGNGHAATTGESPFAAINSAALADLAAWVPALFPAARAANGGYRVSSADLGRDLEEDLSITPQGIKDFGVHDIGDPRQGKRTPIDLVLEHGAAHDALEAASWLAARLGTLLFNPQDPLPIARTFIKRHYQHTDSATLHHHRGLFYAWTGTCYAEQPEPELRARLYEMLEHAKSLDAKGALKRFQPSARRVSDVMDALRAVTHLTDRHDAPAWLDGRTDPPAAEVLACRNGVLHLPTRRLVPSTPLFFGVNAVDFDFQPDAPEPERWTSFLDSLWLDDAEAINTLQELFGYTLTSDTSQQKAFLIVGPRRSGKGTIARVLKALIGQTNVAGPTLSGLGTNFGVAPLIGKPLAIISDARLSGRADQQAIAERLLSISGEDVLTIDRKHLAPWTGTLPTRFLILTNELPKIADSSGALASRFIVLTLTRSFLGREDHGLTDRLLGELPGILNWSIAGWERLRDRGRFQQPLSSAEAIEDLEELGSPISTFVRDRCTVAPGRCIAASALFDAWKAWCEAQGRDHAGTLQTFGRDLRAAVPGLRVVQSRSVGRSRIYEGINLG